MKKTYRVLQVMNALSMGGGETWLMALLRFLKAAGDILPVKLEFDVLLTAARKSLFDDEAESLGAKLHYLHYSVKSFPQFAYGMQRILKEGQYQAIHDHQGYPAGMHFLSGWGRLPPLRIAHIHNPMFDVDLISNWRSDAVISLERQLLSRLATHVMATSEQMIMEYGFNSESFSHLKRGAAYCGFDVTDFRRDYEQDHAAICRELGWDPSAKIMLFAGRLNAGLDGSDSQMHSRKNPGFALQIAREAMGRDADLKLLLAGEGRETTHEFQAMVKAWGLQDRIKFLGVRADLPFLMAGANLLLFPSIAEGLGMVVVEAQAAGLRVLASDSIPRESVVMPEMVRFKSLASGPSEWAIEALRLMSLGRPDQMSCNRAVQESGFSIENSTARLIELYTGAN